MPPPRPGIPSDERVHRLVEWLRSGQRLTTSLAAEAFGVSRRTITRDLTYIREVLALNVEFSSSQRSYVLDEEHAALPFLAFPSLAPVLLNADLAPKPDEDASSETIHVRFSAPAIQAYLARGGQLPTGTRNDDGTLHARFTHHNADEFMSYVLSRGHHIEVLGPSDFRHRVHMEIRRMLEIYDGEPGSNA